MGFLGRPHDWNSILAALPQSWNIHSFDLLQGPQGGSKTELVGHLNNELGKREGFKLVVGYSLGGRLALELTPESYDRLLLIGAHPGLQEGQLARIQSDLQWRRKGSELPTSVWIKLWNQQEVFANDRIRPERNYSESEFANWLGLLENLSLGKQKDFILDRSVVTEKIYWCCGEDDSKFQKLKDKIENWLGKSHVFEIPKSGHGAIFDNPAFVSDLIKEVVGDVC